MEPIQITEKSLLLSFGFLVVVSILIDTPGNGGATARTLHIGTSFNRTCTMYNIHQAHYNIYRIHTLLSRVFFNIIKNNNKYYILIKNLIMVNTDGLVEAGWRRNFTNSALLYYKRRRTNYTSCTRG